MFIYNVREFIPFGIELPSQRFSIYKSNVQSYESEGAKGKEGKMEVEHGYE